MVQPICLLKNMTLCTGKGLFIVSLQERALIISSNNFIDGYKNWSRVDDDNKCNVYMSGKAIALTGESTDNY